MKGFELNMEWQSVIIGGMVHTEAAAATATTEMAVKSQ